MFEPVTMFLFASYGAVGAAGVWIARGRGRYLARLSLPVLGVWLLIPVGAEDLGITLLTIVWSLQLVLRLPQSIARTAVARPELSAFRFTLLDLNWFVALVIVSAAFARRYYRDIAVLKEFNATFPVYSGLEFSVIALFGIVIALGIRHRVLQWAALVAAVPASAAILATVDKLVPPVNWSFWIELFRYFLFTAPAAPVTAYLATLGLLHSGLLADANRHSPQRDFARELWPRRVFWTGTALFSIAWLSIFAVMYMQMPAQREAYSNERADALYEIGRSLQDNSSLGTISTSLVTSGPGDVTEFSVKHPPEVLRAKTVLENPAGSRHASWAWRDEWKRFHVIRRLADTFRASGDWEANPPLGMGSDWDINQPIFRLSPQFYFENGRAIEFYLDILKLADAQRGVGADASAMLRTDLHCMTLVSLAALRKSLNFVQLQGVVALLDRHDWSEPVDLIVQRESERAVDASYFIERLHQLVYAGADTREACKYRERLVTSLVLLLRTDLAIRLFQRNSDRIPQELAELVPEYSPAVPIDPWNGKQLMYQHEASRFVLYSVGPNGVDDGGKGIYPDRMGTVMMDLDLTLP